MPSTTETPTPMRRSSNALHHLRTIAAAAALAAACAMSGTAAWAADVGISRLWQFDHKLPGAIAGQKAEIVAYDHHTDTLWVAGVVGVDVLDRTSGQRVAQIDVRHLGAVNSVAIHDGLAALALENTTNRDLPGLVVFVDTRSRAQAGQPVVVGSLPDMLSFTPDGLRVLVANEATPRERTLVEDANGNLVPAPGVDCPADPEGGVSVIDVASRAVVSVPLSPSTPGYDTLRLFPALGTLSTQPATYCPYGPEPEYIAVDKTGRKAYVSLQEANGIAVLDLVKLRFERIHSLGLKDFSLPGNEIDPDDRDDRLEVRPVPVQGLYQPDTLATYEHRGRSYLVMANEGDARDNGSGDSEDERRGGAGASSVELTSATELARITLSNIDSARGGPLVKFGGHSFSIRTPDGRLVYDSGSLLDREAMRLGIYDDGRSDNKGVEPEGLALLHIEGRVLAFIGLERTLKAAIAVFDITHPRRVRYVDMIVGEGDLSPEGLVAFKAGGRYHLAAAHEVSDTTSLYEITLDRAQGPKR
ncbi:choice-of-anchor I family protein [Rubrivivax sp. RP6-9]|uniref:choice-of-anchor I family protein n=1 Tax=Rubrivivax sp. RP6-9 TaxID=3415750 RepID=UPI003CC51004